MQACLCTEKLVCDFANGRLSKNFTAVNFLYLTTYFHSQIRENVNQYHVANGLPSFGAAVAHSIKVRYLLII